MDEVDQAQQINEQIQADALAAHRRRQGVSPHSSRFTPHGGTHCEVCDEPIPEARRAAMPGCTRCIDCQTILEIHVHGRG